MGQLELRHIAFIYTKYQSRVFKELRKSNIFGESVHIVAPIELKGRFIHQPCDEVSYIYSKDRALRFEDARALIKEVRAVTANLDKKHGFYNFYLASDDHPVAQIIMRELPIHHLIMFEDGLGSYVDHGFLNFRHGARAIFGKLRNIAFFFPYYRSISGCGSHLAHDYFAYSDFAFPRSKRKVNILSRCSLTPSDKKVEICIAENSIIFLGQPLSLDTGLSERDYFLSVERAFDILSRDNYNKFKFYYKKHPRHDFSDSLIYDWLGKSRAFIIIQRDVPAEALMSENRKGMIKLVSYASTALFNIRVMYPDVEVYYIKDLTHRLPTIYTDVLEKVGVVPI